MKNIIKYILNLLPLFIFFKKNNDKKNKNIKKDKNNRDDIYTLW